jgi:hypothetical protein
MQIKEFFSSGHSNLPTSPWAHETSAPSTDVSFFNSALEPSARSTSTQPRPTAPNILSEASGQLSESSNRMAKGLQAFSKGNNDKEARNYPSHLSDTLMLTHVLVKGVSKTAQCVEKICNMQ